MGGGCPHELKTEAGSGERHEKDADQNSGKRITVGVKIKRKLHDRGIVTKRARPCKPFNSHGRGLSSSPELFQVQQFGAEHHRQYDDDAEVGSKRCGKHKAYHDSNEHPRKNVGFNHLNHPLNRSKTLMTLLR